MRVVYWGTYDEGKPRNRILLSGLRQNGVEVRECHRSLWAGVEDKSQLKSTYKRFCIVVLWLLSYPRLIYKYLSEPSHDCVIVGYLGHLDVLVLWPFAKLRKKPIVWDAFISLYDTVVNDRKLISSANPVAFLLHSFEWLACKAADFVFLDTEAHAGYFREEYSLTKNNCFSVFVGAETSRFPNRVPQGARDQQRQEISVLFYGQFIPLHGIETIVKAAALLKDEERISWTLIGKGQVEETISGMLDEIAHPKLQWIPWVDYERLNEFIHQADICLGIFGTSEKAARVIPNKVYQIVACGKPFITRDSAAIRELFTAEDEGIWLVPSGDETALADAVTSFLEKNYSDGPKLYFKEKRSQINPAGVGIQLVGKLQELLFHKELSTK